ncbi:uncharacterized protein N7458_002534 [Penicillium daleae]|uniref:Protein kinase domain-containing protein n=1 Tax=Penicillium daleae TaxID=63821 RepID=A0AAD6CFC6_9EURO|nr:uncharacterized protein N7458_002534 [Penicillium daleae]KAJ5460982.1 hypothetical protein N7458_002534 [Penicillium daleae]
MYQRRFNDRKMPLPLLKTYIRALLTGLDYLHGMCRTVHTGCLDLKLENIMVSFEDPTVLADFINSQLAKPMAFKIDSLGRPVYQSRNDFGPLKSLGSIPQLVDFGLATRLEEDDDWGVWPIQPDHHRAPEVILGNGWQMPADVWNLGVLLWDMIEGKELFQHIHDHEDSRNILGRFLYEALIPDRKLCVTPSFLGGEEKELFLDLAKEMLVWHPDARKTAGELAGHPFLQPRQISA